MQEIIKLFSPKHKPLAKNKDMYEQIKNNNSICITKIDNKCNVKDYYLKYEDLVFSNGEDMRNDYMLASTTGDGIPVFYVFCEKTTRNQRTIGKRYFKG